MLVDLPITANILPSLQNKYISSELLLYSIPNCKRKSHEHFALVQLVELFHERSMGQVPPLCSFTALEVWSRGWRNERIFEVN